MVVIGVIAIVLFVKGGGPAPSDPADPTLLVPLRTALEVNYLPQAGPWTPLTLQEIHSDLAVRAMEDNLDLSPIGEL